MPGYERDPLSVLLDPGARRLLERVYAARGDWVITRLADPSAEVRAYALSKGIDPGGPDNAATVSGKAPRNHRSRWGRAFARSVYYQHHWYGGTRNVRAMDRKRTTRYSRPLELEVGRHLPVRGVIPAGRLVRARLRPGGAQARAAVDSMRESERIYDSAGNRAGAWSDPARRDW